MCLPISAGHGANWLHFVSPDGDDDNLGTKGSPFATIARAVSESKPGDTILLRAGRHVLSGTLQPIAGQSEEKRITYKPWADEEVEIDCGSGSCLDLANKAYLNFFHLKFTSSDTSVGAGMVYFENTRHIDFESCEFSGMPKERGAENSAVIRCMSTGWPDSANTQNSDSCTFRENYFHDNATPAFRLYDTKGWVIENNTFRNCLQAVGGKDEPYDMTVRRNLVIGGDLAFYFPMQGGGGGVTIAENIVVGSGGGFLIGGLGTYDRMRRNVKICNNTFFNVRTAFFGFSDPQFDSGVRIWNNIAASDSAVNIPAGEDVASRFVCLNKYGSTATSSTGYFFDRNDYFMPASDRSAGFYDGGARFAALSDWQAGRAPFDARSFGSDPQFVDARAGDFHLLPTSPCAGTALGGGSLGAYTQAGMVVGRHEPSPTRIGSSPKQNLTARLFEADGYRANGRKAGTQATASGVVLSGDQPSRVVPLH